MKVGSFCHCTGINSPSLRLSIVPPVCLIIVKLLGSNFHNFTSYGFITCCLFITWYYHQAIYDKLYFLKLFNFLGERPPPPILKSRWPAQLPRPPEPAPATWGRPRHPRVSRGGRRGRVLHQPEHQRPGEGAGHPQHRRGRRRGGRQAELRAKLMNAGPK